MIFIYSLGSGGAERVAANLSAHLSRIGHTVTIVTIQGIEHDFYIIEKDIKRIALNFDRNNYRFGRLYAPFKKLAALRSLIHKIQPDIIVGMMTKGSIYAILAALNLKTRVIISERNYPPKQKSNILLRTVQRFAYPMASGAVALTQETATWMEIHTHCPKVTIIPPSATWPLPIVEPVLNISSLVRDQDFVFLAVGRLHKQKGHDLLIRSFSRIVKVHNKIKLIILGEGPERKNLEQLVAKADLTEFVSLPGNAGNISEWYQRADIFVLSSRYEGYCNALAEAMAHGCACISFACDVGPRYMIEHNHNGLLVDPEDVDALAKAMQNLMDNKGLRIKISRKAKEIREKLSEETTMMKWVDLFDQTGSSSGKYLRGINDR